MKKSPIPRANIVHFETLTLYQNVSYKLVGITRLELARISSLDSKSSASAIPPYPPMKMVPSIGLEPTTYRLQGDCSTIEPRRHALILNYKVNFFSI